MAKKVLLLNGSKRKKNTYGMLLKIEKELKSHGIQTEILNLFDYEMKDCVGCEICVCHDQCSLKDDMPAVMQKVLESDGLVLSSPVYMGGVTSKFKTFADRTNKWIHKPITAGMPMLCVATTNTTGLNPTKQFFGTYLRGLGARRGGFIGRAGKAMDKPLTKRETARFIALLSQDKASYRPAIQEIVMFNVGKVLSAKSNGDDHAFWQDRNWSDALYYYPCKMNTAKKTFSRLMNKILNKAMS